MTSRDQRYARIAKACLRAVNESAGGKKNIDADVQRVYAAIDEAFRQEFAALEKELILARNGLQKVSQLESHETSEAAVKIATETLAAITYWGNDDVKH